jgi:hypothetical protein
VCKSPRMGLSNGTIVHCSPALKVAVDLWTRRGRSECVAGYFLTHLHTDHTEGLSNSWSSGRIYCSKASAELLLNKWPGLAATVVPLEVGESSVLSFDCGKTMTVTPLDARHCVVRFTATLSFFFARHRPLVKRSETRSSEAPAFLSCAFLVSVGHETDRIHVPPASDARDCAKGLSDVPVPRPFRQHSPHWRLSVRRPPKGY